MLIYWMKGLFCGHTGWPVYLKHYQLQKRQMENMNNTQQYQVEEKIRGNEYYKLYYVYFNGLLVFWEITVKTSNIRALSKLTQVHILENEAFSVEFCPYVVFYVAQNEAFEKLFPHEDIQRRCFSVYMWMKIRILPCSVKGVAFIPFADRRLCKCYCL